MSEELIRKDFTKFGIKMGFYEFYPLGDTNLKTLIKYEIIPNKDYGKYKLKKPDALLVDRRDRTNIHVIAVIEYKKPSTFNTIQKKEKAYKQCYEFYCEPLNAKIGIITDQDEWFWINPQLKTKKEWDFIYNEDGYPIQIPFTYENKVDENELLNLISKILDNINTKNSKLKKVETQNPSKLADRVWQSIWLASGENPDVCLATFVEIFIFKYLSDLGILTINESGVRVDFDEVSNKDSNSLKYYFEYVRPHVKEMFPVDKDDNTSIINGIVLNPEIDEHNLIFHSILKEFIKFGTLKNIDPAFKSRLYEKFLKKSISQKNWGQYFTPRNIIKAILQMSEIEKLPMNKKIYDPACGVGGFILEPILTKRRGDYFINKYGDLKNKINYVGHDRDPKTIILAKANMLIHISELLKQNPTITKQFASLFNSTFNSLHKSVLGSLNSTNRNYYDLIMTNPPYVTSGSSTQKEVVKENGRLKNFYKINAMGVEGLFVEKIIHELKPNGNAFVIIPDGILNRIVDEKLRTFIRESCTINAIISLPINAFYTSAKKTYILAITKKEDIIPQKEPVFTYLVTNVGETLDVKRFECENDLPQMVKLYKHFQIDKDNFKPDDLKCKIQPITKFNPKRHWSVDRWWTREEKIEIGIEERETVLTENEFYDKLLQSKKSLDDLIKNVIKEGGINSNVKLGTVKQVSLNDDKYFELSLGKRVLKKDVYKSKGSIPVYSSNVFKPFGYLKKSNINDFSKEYILWGIDGNFEFSVKKKDEIFATTDHVGTIKIKDKKILSDYILYQLNIIKYKYGYDRSLRASLTNMKTIFIPIPITKNGSFDMKKQKEVAKKWRKIKNIKKQIEDYINEIIEIEVDFE